MILDTYFETKLANLKFDDTLKAYIISVMKQNAIAANNLDGLSIVQAYVDASSRNDFAMTQNVGDWTMWKGIFRPREFVKNEDANVYIARLAYNDCNLMLRRSWKVFETLSMNFSSIVNEIRAIKWNDAS